MEEDNSVFGAIVITAIIVGLIAYSLGFSAQSGSSSDSSGAATMSSDNTYSAEQYQEVVSCLADANTRLDDINSDSGSVGDGDDYEDLVSTLDDIENNAETFCQGNF